MEIKKITLLVLMLLVGFVSCNKDDDSTDVIVIEVRDRAEQQITDDATLIEYLETHYYNSSEFESNENPSIEDIVITEFGAGAVPDGNTVLKDAVETKIVNFADTDYKIYILRLNQGGGTESPNFADLVRVRYEGFLLDHSVFDSAVTPVDFDLTSLIPAWRKVLTEFNTTESFEDGTGGIVNYMNYGIGVMFVPSGLAYFSNATTGIPAYSPINFKFELLQMAENDHDGDGVPSYLEDLNGNGELINLDQLADDDTDGDSTPNYADSDDDGDGVLTINEDINNDGDPTNDDTDGDGTPNFLDTDDAVSK
ncbi:FKBP-type peptidyl-prolyl cis-trans isomerase [Thalassobellus sediminis]|uniref:FKBP-type peptidyl-prolyl cis-trans isomerase n=1 Tax=Thalassobellus sediminis TaxID=3367753 RepID=UPI00378EEF38